MADPARPGHFLDRVDPIPAPPQSQGLIIDRGLFTMVVTPEDSPLVMVEPVQMPGTFITRYLLQNLEANQSYIMPDVTPGTLFVMLDALPQVSFMSPAYTTCRITR